MGKLLPLSWQEITRALEFYEAHFHRIDGDHVIHRRRGVRALVFPKDDEIPDFVVRNLIRDLAPFGATIDGFMAAAKGRPHPTTKVAALLMRYRVAPDREAFYHWRDACPSWPRFGFEETDSTPLDMIACPNCREHDAPGA